MRGLRRRHGDRGSVSVWVVIFAFTTMILLTLVVDGGQVMIAKSRAADIAEQAARAAADDIDPAALRGGQVAIAQGACDAAGPAAGLITSYAKGVGVTASMQSCAIGTGPGGAPDVTVAVQVSMKPAIPAGAFSAISVSASETAYLACGTANVRTACLWRRRSPASGPPPRSGSARRATCSPGSPRSWPWPP
jgi:Flp pilus assembly protein TadG